VLGEELAVDLVLRRGQAVHAPTSRRILRGSGREVDVAGGEDGRDPVLAGPPVHVAAVVGIRVERPHRTRDPCLGAVVAQHRVE
jgi:hypothetical protein